MPPYAKLDSILMPDLTIPFELSTAVVVDVLIEDVRLFKTKSEGETGPGRGTHHSPQTTYLS